MAWPSPWEKYGDEVAPYDKPEAVGVSDLDSEDTLPLEGWTNVARSGSTCDGYDGKDPTWEELMHWEPCAGCGSDTIIFDLTKTKRGYFCKECQEKVIDEIAKDPAIQAAAQEFANSRAKAEATIHPLQKAHGFTKPEDGSERRFVFNAVKQGEKPPGVEQTVTVPWVKFRFWWVVHNLVAHSLIAVAPRRTFFRFHDWTSRKMHDRS